MVVKNKNNKILTLFFNRSDIVIKVAFLGNNNEDENFMLTFFSIMKRLGIPYVELSSYLDISSLEYVILNSSVIEKQKEIKCEHFFINMDKVNENNNLIMGNLITYGFGNKNTVTISSIEKQNSGFVYCLQRFVKSKDFKMLDPQEIPILTHIKSEEYLYPYMVAISIALLEGINCEEIKKKLDSKNLIYSI